MRIFFLLSLDLVNRHVSIAIRTIALHCIVHLSRRGMGCIAHASFGLRRLSPGMRVLLLRQIWICVYICVCLRAYHQEFVSYLSQTGIVCGAIIGHHAQQRWTVDWAVWKLFFAALSISCPSVEWIRKNCSSNVFKRMCMESSRHVNLNISSFTFIVIFFSFRRKGECIVYVWRIDRRFSKFLDLKPTVF